MSCSYWIDAKRHLVVTRLSGTVTEDQGRVLHHSIGHDPRFDRLFCQLADWREIKAMPVTFNGVQNVGAMNPFGTGAHRAIIVSQDFQYGLARMYQASHQGPDIVEVFRELTPALAWLGLQEADLPTGPPDGTFD